MAGPSTLILETSTAHASLALAGPREDVIEREFASDRSHQGCLFGPLAELLESAMGGRLAQVLVGSGPGSYSGTRVGIAAAQGVALARDCPAVAVPSLLALPAAAAGAACLVIGDARRGGYWIAQVVACRLEQAPHLADAAGLAAAVSSTLEHGLEVVSVEDPARFPLPDELTSRVLQQIPSAARLWHAWCRVDEATRAAWTAAIPQPIYLKPPHITPAKRPWWVPS